MEQKPLWTEQSGRLTLRPFTVYINAAKILKKSLSVKKTKRNRTLTSVTSKYLCAPSPQCVTSCHSAFTETHTATDFIQETLR